jgi:molecular chaperone GrpE
MPAIPNSMRPEEDMMADETAQGAGVAEGAKPATAAAADPAAPEATPANGADTPRAGDPYAEAAERLVSLANENAELKERVLRMAAEMENHRRRSEREAADAKQYAVTGFARDLLTVGDNLRRALDAVPAEARQEDGALAKLIEGVELTEREFQRIIGRHGVKRIEAEGQKFDPHFHQAIFEVEDAAVPPGAVAQVMQEGYALGDRVLRPAMVGVARKTKAATAQPAEAEAGKAD